MRLRSPFLLQQQISTLLTTNKDFFLLFFSISLVVSNDTASLVQKGCEFFTTGVFPFAVVCLASVPFGFAHLLVSFVIFNPVYRGRLRLKWDDPYFQIEFLPEAGWQLLSVHGSLYLNQFLLKVNFYMLNTCHEKLFLVIWCYVTKWNDPSINEKPDKALQIANVIRLILVSSVLTHIIDMDWLYCKSF